jgi:RNA polymerase sigma-70 factor, ECF subfamily
METAALVTAARHGDEDAFRRLVEPLRGELHGYCYRMLGSVHDADDALQEALLRAWRGLPRFAGRSSLRAWLYRIATNACLDVIARRPKRVLPIDYEPLVESAWVEPIPDAPDASYEQRESVELAFIAALQHLAPNQRAALILREVLGFSASEAAEALETTVPAINSALKRAREGVRDRLPEQSQQATLRTLGDERLRALVKRYIDALDRADVDAVVALLTEDATWSMPPYEQWFRGREPIVAFLRAGPMRERWRHMETRANGQPAVACYRWSDVRGAYVANVIDVLTLRGERIDAVTAFVGGEAFARFGLPGELNG